MPGVVGAAIEEATTLSLLQRLSVRATPPGVERRHKAKLVCCRTCPVCTPKAAQEAGSGCEDVGPTGAAAAPLVWDVERTGDALRQARHQAKMQTKHARSVRQSEVLGLPLGWVHHVACSADAHQRARGVRSAGGN